MHDAKVEFRGSAPAARMSDERKAAAPTPHTTQQDLAELKIDRSKLRRRVPLWPFIGVGLVVAAVMVLQKLKESMDGVAVVTAPAVKVHSLQALAAGQQPEPDLSAAGYVVADRQAVLAAKITGRLAKLYVKEAQRVTQGQLVAEVEHHEIDALIVQTHAERAEAQAEIERLRVTAAWADEQVDAARTPLATTDAEIEELKIQWADAKRRLERNQKLAEAEALGYSEVDDRRTEIKLADARIETARHRKAQVQAQVAVAQTQAAAAQAYVKVAESRVKVVQARIKVLEAQRVEYFITAPFDGVVTEQAAEQGEIIAPVSIGGQLARGSIVTVADWTSLQAEVDVAESYIGRVKAGQRAAIIVDALPGNTFPGRVQRILPRANRSKATVQVRVEFTGERDARILPEMGIRVKFLSDSAPPGAEHGTASEVICVPSMALLTDAAGDYVWTIEQGLAKRVHVELGAQAADWIEIKSGLKTGARVVVAGAEHLKQDGQKVKLPDK